MLGLGTAEIILVLVLLLVFFGKDKLPELARSIGKSFKELKSGFEHSPHTKTSAKSQTQDKTEASGKQST